MITLNFIYLFAKGISIGQWHIQQKKANNPLVIVTNSYANLMNHL
jgi:hypothetical protein